MQDLALSIDTDLAVDGPDPRRFVVAARHGVLRDLVDSIMQGAAFVALTGPPGVGKTAMAAAIRDELVQRAAHVLAVSRGASDSIRLSDIAGQLLCASDATPGQDDIERLFDAMTTRPEPDSRSVLLIDDAELLQNDAAQYLRLLSSISAAQMPAVIFVGRSTFWQVTGQTTRAQLTDMITTRWELDRLTPRETRSFVEQSLEASGLSAAALLDTGALDALVRRSDGSFRHVLSVLSLARKVQQETRQSRLTVSVIEAAAATLAAETAVLPDNLGRSYGNNVVRPAFRRSADSDVARSPRDDASQQAPTKSDHAVGGVVADPADDHTVSSTSPAGDGDTPSTDLPGQAAAEPNATSGARGDHPFVSAAARIAVRAMVAGAITCWPTALQNDRIAAVAVAVAVMGHTPLAQMEDPPPTVEPPPAPAPAPVTESKPAQPVAAQSARPAGDAAPVESSAAATPPLTSGKPEANTAGVPADAPAQPIPAPSLVQSESPAPAPVVPAPTATITAQHAETAHDAATAQHAETAHDAATAQHPETAHDVATAEHAETAHDAATAEHAEAAQGTATAQPADQTVATAAPPAPIPAAPKPHVAIDPKELVSLLARGDATLELGDISAARMFYERAADLGSGRAATSAGRTYDPDFLATIHANGIEPDPALALRWYRQGSALGDREGERLAGSAALRLGR